MSETPVAKPGRFALGARSVGYMVATTLIIMSIVSALAIATRPTVLRNERVFQQRAILGAAGLDETGAPEAVSLRFDRHVSLQAPGVYAVRDTDGRATGVVVEEAGPGLWGTIKGLVGFGADGATITGFRVLEQNETPGLGARIVEPWFIGQFNGKRGPLKGYVAEKTANEDDDEFDAVTGATITTKAVRELVNKAHTRAAADAGVAR